MARVKRRRVARVLRRASRRAKHAGQATEHAPRETPGASPQGRHRRRNGGDRPRRAAPPRARLALATTAAKNTALRDGRAPSARNAATILAENALDVADMKQATAAAAAFLDRLTLNADRIEAMAHGIEEIAALPDPVGAVHRRMGPPERPPHRAGAHAARRHRHHLREPPERHRRRRRALPQGRQRRDPARRLGLVPLVVGDPSLPRRGPHRRRPARRARSSSCRPATAPPSA